MTRFLILLAAVAALVLGGCADSLVVREAADASEAPYSPDPAGHIPARSENPIRRGTGDPF